MVWVSLGLSAAAVALALWCLTATRKAAATVYRCVLDMQATLKSRDRHALESFITALTDEVQDRE